MAPVNFLTLLGHIDVLGVPIYDLDTEVECNFTDENKLGTGRTMDVYMAYLKEDNRKIKLAAKVTYHQLLLHTPDYRIYDILDPLCQEIRIMQHLSDHPNIIDFYGMSFNELKPIILVEFSIGSLHHYLEDMKDEGRPVDWATKAAFCCDVADGLHALHAVDIVHGDIKADNVLLFPISEDDETQNLVAKIADFGYSATAASIEKGYGEHGTRNFYAPECTSGASHEMQLFKDHPKKDNYTFGLFVWQVSKDGEIPYSSYEDIDVEKIKHEDKDLNILFKLLPSDTPEEFRFVISKTTRYKPSDRATLSNARKNLFNLLDDNAAMFRKLQKEVKETFINNTTKLPKFSKTEISSLKSMKIPSTIKTKIYNDFEKAANKKNAEAAFSLSICYKEGFGVNMDSKKMVEWLIKAAEYGSLEAIIELANGFDIKKLPVDPDTAFIWYIKAAHTGSLIAQFKVSICYYTGVGVKKDKVKGDFWISKFESAVCDDVDSTIDYKPGLLNEDTRNNQISNIKTLMADLGASVFTLEKRPMSLRTAFLNGCNSIVKFLISIHDAGVNDVNIEENEGFTSLLKATLAGNTSMAKVFVNLGMDMNIENKDRLTPLNTAASNFEMNHNIRRLAVVIGNANYEHLTSLPNPSNDAKAINEKLRSLGYEVTLGIDQQKNEILEIFTNIQKSWKHEAEEIVFYYSGHGISIDGKAYIAPVETKYNISSDFFEDNYLSVEEIIRILLKHRRDDNYPIILILDCCCSKVLSDSEHPKDLFQKIEGEFGTKSNIAILYSTAHGEPALDGSNEIRHSPYTQILLDNIEKDLTIWDINSVISSTLDEQVSWMSQCLHRPYRFKLPDFRELPQTPFISNDTVVSHFYGVPPRNQNYVNRPRIISKMRALLSDKPPMDGDDILNILALNGLGGMGKTQLMLQYCYLYRQEYDYIFWLEADGQMVTLESFQKLACDNLGLDKVIIEKYYEEERVIDFVCSWLEKRTKWLLLLNNVDEEEVRKLLNHLPRIGGDIILTTREPIPSTMAKVISVPKMDENEALSLLLNLKEQEFGSINHQNIEYGKKIVNELDYMPLAISLGRSYMNDMRISPKNYLDVLKNQRGKLFTHVNQDDSQYNHTLTTVWKLSFERIQNHNPLAGLILDICAFLQPEAIPVSFFEKQFISLNDGPILPLSSSGLEDNLVQTAIAVLEKFSFVTIASKEEEKEEEDFLSIHGLVQESVFNEKNDEQKIHLAYNISKAFNGETKFSDPYAVTTQKIMNIYLSHIQHFILLLDKLNENPLLSADLEDLLIRTVDYLQRNKIYIDTEKLINLALSLSKSLHGEDSLLATRSLLLSARQFQNKGIYSDAEPLYQRVLKIREAALGPDHSDMATPLHYLASLYYDQGKYADDKQLLERALKIREEVLGKEHQETAHSLHDLALVYGIQGNYAKAESYHQRAIAIYQKVFGDEHPQLVLPQTNLAAVYSKQFKYAETKEAFEKALLITERRKHPDTATTLVHFASFYCDKGEYAKAELMCKQAVEINKNILGDHPRTAISFNGLADVYKNQGDFIKAESLYKKAVEIMEKTLGTEHPTTATFLNGLASLYDDQSRYDEAKSHYQRALGIREKILGSDHQDTITTLYYIASLCEKQGDYDDAEQKYNQALKFRNALPEHLIMANILNGLATLYFNQGKLSRADPLFQEALEIYQKVHGFEHESTTIVLDNLALLYSEQGKNADAKKLRQRSQMIKKKLGLESLSRKKTFFRRWTDWIVKKLFSRPKSPKKVKLKKAQA